jgi:DNA-binding transcriptional ArsR family regulator
MDAVFETLADPGRRRILDVLAEGERPAGDFTPLLGISQPGVSRHLRVLREAGLVTVRKDATRRLYSLNPARLREIDRWLDRYRRLWTTHLYAWVANLDRDFPQ